MGLCRTQLTATMTYRVALNAVYDTFLFALEKPAFKVICDLYSEQCSIYTFCSQHLFLRRLPLTLR